METKKIKFDSLDENTLMSRDQVCKTLHVALSTFGTRQPYIEIPRIKIGRHILFLRSDIENFILKHRTNSDKNNK